MTDKTAAQINEVGCSGMLMGLAAIVVFIGSIWLFTVIWDHTHPPPTGTTADALRDDVGAKVACEEMGKQELKAPSTASFSGAGSTTTIYLGTGHYHVRGWVDAQNSFGAKVRSGYTCKATNKGGDAWEKEEVTLPAAQ